MKKQLLTLALATAIPAMSAHAEISFHGFANIVAGQASSDDQLWGYDDNVDFKQGSLFALQASTDLGEKLSATVQIVSRGEDDWDTEFEWAYLSYQVNDQLQVLAGRQRLPLYMYSDYLDVSYAMPWISPPRGVYDIELNGYDGLSANYSFTLGEFDTNIQAVYGSEESTIDLGGRTVAGEFDDIYGAIVTLNRDWLTLRAGYFGNKNVIPPIALRPILEGWQQVEGGQHVIDQITIVDDSTNFLEFGFRVDYNNLLLIGEYTRLDGDGNTPIIEDESMYITAGYRFDNVLVHLTYGEDETTTNRVLDTLTATQISENNALVNRTRSLLEGQQSDNSYITVGTRWDFHDSAALKVEYTRFDDDKFGLDANLVRTALVTVF